LAVVCAAGGQNEENLGYGNIVRNVVNKNNTEPQAEQSRYIMGCSILDNRE